MSKLLNILVVLITISLATIPIVRDQLHAEVARWYLAYAANRVAEGKDIQSQLANAEAWGGDLTGLRDYWLLRAQQALMSSPDEVAAVIAQAVARDASNADIGGRFAQLLMENGLFADAVEVLEASLSADQRQLAANLNQLAYLRALAAIDLDQALKDIDQALSKTPNDPALRDTRAWVLYQMGKPHEALPDADFAVKAFDGLEHTGLVGETLGWLERRVASPPDPRSEDQTLTRREAGEMLWGSGAVHYHRGKILEALGRSQEAEAELNWLRQRKLPTDGSIY